MQISDVPPYLRDGSFYKNLDPNDHDVFQVPDQYVKCDTFVESSEDLKYLLSTARYWGLKSIPIEAIYYIFSQGTEPDIEEFIVAYPELGKIIEVKDAPFSNAIKTAIKLKLGVEVVRVLRQLNYPFDAEACESAAVVGDLGTLMYLHQEGCSWDERTPKAAVNNNHCSCLHYALEHNCPVHSGLLHVAAFAGNVKDLECLLKYGLQWSDLTMFVALANRKFENVCFLIGAGCPIPHYACATAAMVGDLASLTFLHERGQPLDLACSVSAAAGGHLSCVIYLHQHNCPWSERCCEKAAFGGHWRTLKYLHENGCPWHGSTTTAAMVGGSWSCFVYAVLNGVTYWTPLYILVHIALLLYAFYASYTKDRTKNDCASAYILDSMSFLAPICNFNAFAYLNWKEYYAEHISLTARSGYMIGFTLTAMAIYVYDFYFLWTCQDDME